MAQNRRAPVARPGCGDVEKKIHLIKKPLFCSGSRVGRLCNDRGKSISVVHDLNCSKSPPPSMAVGKETTNGLLSYWHRQNQVFFFNWLVLVVTPIFKISKFCQSDSMVPSQSPPTWDVPPLLSKKAPKPISLNDFGKLLWKGKRF